MGKLHVCPCGYFSWNKVRLEKHKRILGHGREKIVPTKEYMSKLKRLK
jgi:hypothetical protein